MIEAILAELSRSDFDFREFSNTDDPLSSRFPDWVAYYRLKFAIAKVLQPGSLLELGVRYGYSAASFLKASPHSRYVGIDPEHLGSDVLGWARRITANYNAEFIVADAQQMERFPGGLYDLIHISAQHDGYGTFHHMRRAVAQARWVLVDGYFWTEENLLNGTDFLRKYKDVLEYTVTIPGYAGELLMRVSDSYLASCAAGRETESSDSRELTQFYDSHYYLNDCGGHREFRRDRGVRVEDPRLLSLLMLTRLAGDGPMLDLGCGRGEVTYQLATNGRDVTAVDYSSAAIDLAKSCFDNAPAEVKDRATFVCGDVGALQQLEGRFAGAVAGDLIEHLSPEELVRLYANVSRLLQPDGAFVVHTAPSLWYHTRDYARRRKVIAQLGGFLPAEPRTRYELLMHINEQSPARLRRALSAVFPFVKVWVGSAPDPRGSLAGDWKFARLASAPGVYAVASHTPIDVDRIRLLLRTTEHSADQRAKVSIRASGVPAQVEPGMTFSVEATINNASDQLLSSLPPYPVNVSYHWQTPARDRTVVFDGLRSAVPFGIDSGEERTVLASIEAPRTEGEFLLCLTLVQESCCWFETTPGFAPAESTVMVQRRSA